MIKGLQGDAYITVSGGNTSVPYITQNVENPMQGMMRVWGSDMQVFTGSSWLTMNTSYSTVSLNPTCQSVILWAANKMAEEKQILDLAKEHPAIQIALDNLDKAKQQLDVTIILSKENNEKTTS